MPWFGPPRSFTCASACPWLGHLVSGLLLITRRPIKARFHCASDKCLKLAIRSNSLDRSTKSTPSPRRAPTPCTHTISGSISLPSRGSFNLSLTVLVLYRSQVIFSLGTWSSRFQSGFLVSRPTRQNKNKVSETWHTGLSPSMARLSRLFCSHRYFFTLYRVVVASVGQAENSKIQIICLDCLLSHNPLITFVYQLIHLN